MVYRPLLFEIGSGLSALHHSVNHYIARPLESLHFAYNMPLPPPDSDIASEGDQMILYYIGECILLKCKGK